jgi:hypothetical protein
MTILNGISALRGSDLSLESLSLMLGEYICSFNFVPTPWRAPKPALSKLSTTHIKASIHSRLRLRLGGFLFITARLFRSSAPALH